MDTLTSYQYEQEVTSLAKEAAERIRAGDEQSDVVHELCDGHQWVIYTYYNYQVMQLSRQDAFELAKDVFGTEGLTSSAVGAYLCLEADVNEALSIMDLEASEDEEATP